MRSLVMNSYFFFFTLFFIGISAMLGIIFIPFVMIGVYYFFARRFERLSKNNGKSVKNI